MVTVDAPAAVRRDRRPTVALGLALVAVAVAAAAAGVWGLALSADEPSQGWLAAVVPALGTGLAPVLALASATIVLRMRGVLSAGRATAIIALGAIALPLAALATASWSAGFDDADAGRPITGLGALTAPLALASLVAGAALLGLLLQAVLVLAGMSRASAAALALLLAVVGAPAAGFALVSPASSAALAVAAVIVAAFASPRSAPRVERESSIRTPDPARTPAAVRSTHELAIGLARLAAGAGIIGVLFAILAPALWPVPIDGTEAMIVGISILLASGLPLLAAVVLLVETRFPVATLLVRGPATALALALAAMGYWYTSAPDGDANWWAISVASLLVGVAVGGMSFLLPLSRPVAIAVGLAVALALAAAQVAAVIPMLAFALSVVAIVIVVLDAVRVRRLGDGMMSGARRRRARRPLR